MGNPSIRVFCGPRVFGARAIQSSRLALDSHGIAPLSLDSKEHLGILNGTAFSASVASLALHDAVNLALLTQVCTAMGVEALAGNRASFHPFIHAIARPHPGQVSNFYISISPSILQLLPLYRLSVLDWFGISCKTVRLQPHQKRKFPSKKMGEHFDKIVTHCVRRRNSLVPKSKTCSSLWTPLRGNATQVRPKNLSPSPGAYICH